MDTSYTAMEETFQNKIEDKVIEIEHLDPEEMNRKEA